MASSVCVERPEKRWRNEELGPRPRVSYRRHQQLAERCRVLLNRVAGPAVCNQTLAPHAPAFDARFLFTSSSGVYLYDRGQIVRLISGFCFGICQNGSEFLCTQEYYFDGKHAKYLMTRILSFTLDGNRAVNAGLLRTGLPSGAHQIAMLDGHVVYLDGFNNLVVLCPVEPRPAWGFNGATIWQPDLGQPEKSKHINSIQLTDHEMLILAHNDFQSTGRNSALRTICKKTGKPLGWLDLPARSAHDIRSWQGSIYFCDSEGGNLVRDEEVVFHAPDNLFTRGLMLTEELIVLGASERVHRSLREKTVAHLLFLSPDYKLLGRYQLGEFQPRLFGGNVKSLMPLPHAA